MKYLIVIDSTANGRRRRSYLFRSSKLVWSWTSQREEAAEFANPNEAQQIIETTMRLKKEVRILPVSEDPIGAGSR
jgi:hypothetical protein